MKISWCIIYTYAFKLRSCGFSIFNRFAALYTPHTTTPIKKKKSAVENKDEICEEKLTEKSFSRFSRKKSRENERNENATTIFWFSFFSTAFLKASLKILPT